MASFLLVFVISIPYVSSQVFNEQFIKLTISAPHDQYSGVYFRPSDTSTIKTCGYEAKANYETIPSGNFYPGTYFYERDGGDAWIYLDGQTFNATGSSIPVSGGIYFCYTRLLVTEQDPNSGYDGATCDQYTNGDYALVGPLMPFNQKDWKVALDDLSPQDNIWTDKNGLIADVSLCKGPVAGCNTEEPTKMPTVAPTTANPTSDPTMEPTLVPTPAPTEYQGTFCSNCSHIRTLTVYKQICSEICAEC